MPRIALFFLSFATAFSSLVHATEFYVAPNGNNANPGTKKEPFATLAHARDRVRQAKSAKPKQDVTVWLRGGTYPCCETLVFTLEDSAGPGQRITYAAFPGEKPVLSAGVPIQNWKRLEATASDELPKAARGKIWVADVSFLRELQKKQEPSPSVTTQMESRHWFHTLYEGNKSLPRARGKSFSLVKRTAPNAPDFSFPKGSLRNWPDIANAELHLIPHYYWISNVLPIEQVNEADGTGRTTTSCTYFLNPPGKMTYRPTAWVENSLALLDEPGEWALDSDKGLLYLWPRGDKPSDQIVAPACTELLRVAGRIDYEGPKDTPCLNLTFRGLTFAHGDRYPWQGKTGWGLQHDWERFDSPSALVRFRGTEGCHIEDCHFMASGCSGVRVDLHGQKNRICGNHFEHLGGVAVLLAGYGPGTKNVNRKNTVENNLIHNIGEIYQGSPGIFAWQSGENHIAQNHLYDLPYTAICVTGRIVWGTEGRTECSRTIRWSEVGGKQIAKTFRDKNNLHHKHETWSTREKMLHSRDNLVARNDIHDVTQKCGDGNCIYISGAGDRNHILENYCHDCEGRRMHSMIRCDDDQNGVVIERNILFRFTQGRGEGITSKGRNDIVENILADLQDGQGARHRGYIIFPNASVAGSKIQRNVLYSRKKGQYAYGQGNEPTRLNPTQLLTTKADSNLYYCTEEPEQFTSFLPIVQAKGIEGHSLSTDPLFVNLEKEDFRFQPNSPALKIGIPQPIAIKEVGLQAPYRDQ